MEEKIYISLSGLIGAGKTTLAKRLAEKLKLPVYHESVQDQELLNKFYRKPKKYAFVLQYKLLNDRYEQQQQIIWSNKGAIQDRSIYEDGVFVKMLYKDGVLNKDQYDTYNKTFSLMSRNMTHATCIVHLDVTPEEALRRIRLRNREMEKGITLEYLTNLNESYKEFTNDISKTIPVIFIDWSEFYEDDIDFIANAILDTIQNITKIHRLDLKELSK